MSSSSQISSSSLNNDFDDYFNSYQLIIRSALFRKKINEELKVNFDSFAKVATSNSNKNYFICQKTAFDKCNQSVKLMCDQIIKTKIYQIYKTKQLNKLKKL